MNIAVIGVGSNINPRTNIRKARFILTQEQNLLKVSRIVRTAAIGKRSQPDYLNGAFLIKTELKRPALKKYLKSVEERLKRRRSKDKYAPRTIDLDLIVFNGRIIDRDFFSRDFLKDSVMQVFPQLKAD